MVDVDAIVNDFSDKYKIEGHDVYLNDEKVKIEHLPLIDKMKEIGDQEIVSGMLQELDERYDLFSRAVTGSKGFQTAWEEHKDEVAELAEEFRVISEKYDLNPNIKLTRPTMVQLSVSYGEVFGEDPFEWAFPILKKNKKI